MTNFSHSSALKAASAAAFAAILAAGCSPKDGVKEYADGSTAYEAHNLAKAEKLFTKSLLYAPENVDALVMLARVQSELGKIPEAEQTIERATKLAADAPDVALLDAEIAFYARDFARAKRGFTSVAKNTALTPEAQSLGWTGVGIVEMACDERERRDFARIAFLRAIRLDRLNASALYHLGLLYRGDTYGYLDAALEQFEKFVRLGDKVDSRAQYVQSTIIPGIKADITRRAAERPGASRRDANAAAAALARAEAAWKKGNYKTARNEYEAAYKADVLSFQAALGLAQAWEKTDTSPQGLRNALTYYKAACSLRSWSVKTFITAGTLAAKIGQHATAAELFSRAVAANPADITAVDGLIRALRKAGVKSQSEAADAYQSYRETITVRRSK